MRVIPLRFRGRLSSDLATAINRTLKEYGLSDDDVIGILREQYQVWGDDGTWIIVKGDPPSRKVKKNQDMKCHE